MSKYGNARRGKISPRSRTADECQAKSFFAEEQSMKREGGSENMKTLCIVSCSEMKIWRKNPSAGPTSARHAYIGPFSTKCREYAERFYSSWCFLSAKYGFLFPDEVVPGPYNVTFTDSATGPIALEELSKQRVEKGLDKYDKVVILGGKHYKQVVREVFGEKLVESPFSDYLWLGHRMKVLNDAIEKGIALS